MKIHAIVEFNSPILECLIKRLPPLRALKCFEASARLGSFQEAAEKLYVTPSAISHQIKTLETFLGVELFIRRTRQIELTAAGSQYFKAVHNALTEIDQSTQKLTLSQQSGKLHLSVIPAFLTRWLLPRISRFREANPDIKLEISSATGLIDFDQVDTDMAVYFGDGKWDDIEVHFLRHYQQVPVCSPTLLKTSPIEKAEDLLNHTLLHVQKRDDEWSTWFSQTGTPFKESQQGMNLSNSALTTAAAIQGVGIALADIGFVSQEIASGDLLIPIKTTIGVNKSFYLVYQKNRVMTFAMKAFHAWLIEEMSKDLMSPKSSN